MPTPSRGSAAFDLIKLLDALAGVELIIVGGVAGALHGSPRVTFDLDIVPSATDPNRRRLRQALEELQAEVRDPAGRRLPVDEAMLDATCTAAAGGQLRLRTLHGPLDILWKLHDGRGFEELRPACVVLADEEREVVVLGLEALIRIKESTGHRKDQEDAAYLRGVIEKQRFD